MRRYFLMLLLVCWVPLIALPCANDEDEGGVVSPLEEANKIGRQHFPIPKGHPLDMKDSKVIYYMESDKKGYESGDVSSSVNYSVYLIFGKQFEEAEKVCRSIAEQWPNRYSTAANLGTILEVNGKPKEALEWIQKAIAINPESHNGSEWIHVKILESKLSGKPISGSEIVGIDFGQAACPQSTLPISKLDSVRHELFYQLEERVTFIQPEDEYIAALLFELGNLCFAVEDYAGAIENYKNAARYGFKDPLLLKRIDCCKDIQNPDHTVLIVTLISISMTLGILTWIIIRRRKKNQ